MKTVTYIILFGILVFSPFVSINAQNIKGNLEKGVDAYNALREFSKDFTSLNITDQNVKEVQDRHDKAIALFDLVLKSSTTDEMRAAKYYKINTRYKLAYTIGLKGRNKECLAMLKEIESDMNTYSETIFPIRYTFGDKKFVLGYKDFAPTLGEFYGIMGELLMNESKTDEALIYLQKTVKSAYSSNYSRLTAYNKLLSNKQKNNKFDKEMLDWAYAMMDQYEMLPEDIKKKIKDSAAPDYHTAAKYFNVALDKIPLSVEKANICSKAAIYLSKYTEAVKEPSSEKRKTNGEYAKKWFRTAINDGKDDRQMLADALKMAKMIDGNKSEFGIFVLDKWADKLLPSQCEGFKRASEDYTFYGNAKKSDEFKKKAEECQIKQEAEAKRLAEERRKEQVILEKERKKISREGHFLAGINVVPLFYKDFGGVINYGFRNTLFEASFLHVSKKKESLFDLQLKSIKDNLPTHFWDGFFTHIAYKGANRNGSTKSRKIYTGFLLGYNQRNFESFTSEVTNTKDSKKEIKTFDPSTRQYIFMANAGIMILKQYGIDVYAGVGGTYNKFNGGNSEVWNKLNYKITDAMVANRKPSYFGLTGRVGVSIGIGW